MVSISGEEWRVESEVKTGDVCSNLVCAGFNGLVSDRVSHYILVLELILKLLPYVAS